jgi:hypothetical protein
MPFSESLNGFSPPVGAPASKRTDEPLIGPRLDGQGCFSRSNSATPANYRTVGKTMLGEPAVVPAEPQENSVFLPLLSADDPIYRQSPPAMFSTRNRAIDAFRSLGNDRSRSAGFFRLAGGRAKSMGPLFAELRSRTVARHAQAFANPQLISMESVQMPPSPAHLSTHPTHSPLSTYLST